MNKPIRFTNHSLINISRRGATQEEIIEAITTEEWTPAMENKMECNKNFPYNNVWNGTTYAIKRVRPIFVDEPDEIVVITVYTYYF